jgi:hypothetical protein
VAKKKLTAAERVADEQMLEMLEWASTKKAAELLEKRGVIETGTGSSRLKPKK